MAAQDSNQAGTDISDRRLARRMVLIAFLAQNAATGAAFGTFGTLISGLESQYHVSRSVSSLGISLVLVAIAISNPIISTLIRRFSIRLLMTTGAVLGGLGYAIAAIAPNIAIVLAAYGLLIGVGFALLGSVTPAALIGNWYVEGRGRALGFVYMPAFLAVMPFFATWLAGRGGVRLVFATLAFGMFAIIPALQAVRERPLSAVPGREGRDGRGAHAAAETSPLAYRDLARSSVYWRIVICGCCLAASGVSMATHIVPMALSWGYDPIQAATLLSLIGALGIIGSPACGWLVDRFGGVQTLALNAGIQSLLWIAAWSRPEFVVGLGCVVLAGILQGGMTGAFSATLSERFGPANFGQTFGLFSLLNLPFAFGAPFLSGVSFASTGSYATACLAEVLSLVAATLVAASTVRAKGAVRKYREQSGAA